MRAGGDSVIPAAADPPGHRRRQLVTPFSASMGGGGIPGRTGRSGEQGASWVGGGVQGRAECSGEEGVPGRRGCPREAGHSGEEGVFWGGGSLPGRTECSGEQGAFRGGGGIPGRRGHPKEEGASQGGGSVPGRRRSPREVGCSGEEGAFRGGGGIPGAWPPPSWPLLSAPPREPCEQARRCEGCVGMGAYGGVRVCRVQKCVHMCVACVWVCGRLYVFRCGLWPCVLVCLDMDLCVVGGECRCRAVYVYVEL